MARYYSRNGDPITCDQWAKAFGDEELHRVALTEIDNYTVSTVWLGLDHGFGNGPPLIFETMIFGNGPLDQEQWRYSTLEEAQAGHEQRIIEIRQGLAEE